MASKLEIVEKNILPDTSQNPEAEVDTECVMELLDSVTEVTNEYVRDFIRSTTIIVLFLKFPIVHFERRPK